MDVTDEPISRRDQQLSLVVWRGRYLVLLAVVVTVAVAVLMSLTSTKVYEATAVLQAQSEDNRQAPSDALTLQQASQGAASTYARLLGDRSVLERIRATILDGSLSVGEIQARTSAKAVPDTSLIEVSAEAGTVAEARALASDLVTRFISLNQASSSGRSLVVQKQLEQKIARLSDQIQALAEKNPGAAERLAALRAARAALSNRLALEVASGIEQSSRVGLVAPPAGSDVPIRPRTVVNVAGGVLLGLILGISLALLRARLDTLVRSSREVAEALGAPILASIPLVDRPESSAPVAESYEIARTNLAFLAENALTQVVTVTSYTAGEGKSSSVVFLGRAEARAGKRVLIIDADMRTRQLTRSFGFTGSAGLSRLLSQSDPQRNVGNELEPNLFFLPAGTSPPDPVQLLASPRMRALLEELRQQFEVILIDAPPVVHLADAPILAGLADGIIVVARVGLTKNSYLVELDTQLRNIPRPVLGAIVIERRTLEHDYPLTAVTPRPERR